MLINNHGIKNNKKNKIEYHVINIEGMMNLESQPLMLKLVGESLIRSRMLS